MRLQLRLILLGCVLAILTVVFVASMAYAQEHRGSRSSSTTTTTTTTSQERSGGGWHGHPHYYQPDIGTAIIGGAIGTIFGNWLSPPPVVVVPAPVVVAPEPMEAPLVVWSPEWMDHCAAKYRSFEPQTGFFLGFDGVKHFCR